MEDHKISVHTDDGVWLIGTIDGCTFEAKVCTAQIISKPTGEGFASEISGDSIPVEVPAEMPNVASETEAEAMSEAEATEANVGTETPETEAETAVENSCPWIPRKRLNRRPISLRQHLPLRTIILRKMPQISPMLRLSRTKRS